MGADRFPFGFPQQLKEYLPTHRRGLVGRTPVVVLVHGGYHAKVMLPSGETKVFPRGDVWVEGVDPD